MDGLVVGCRERRAMTSAAETALEQERQDELFAAAQEAFPDVHIIELSAGGFAAVPAGTEVVTADDLDGLVAKLRKAGL